MAQIAIRSEQKANFEILFSLEKEYLEQLVNSLEQVPPGILLPKLVEHIDTDIDSSKLEILLQIIISLHRLRDSTGFSSKKIINDLLLALETDNLDKVKEYLQIVFDIKGAFPVTVQALSALVKHEKLLLNTEIITDVRPIFQDNKLLGFTCIYNLIIEYRHGDENKKSQLALDKSDLLKLQEQINSAIAKTQELNIAIDKLDDILFVEIEGG